MVTAFEGVMRELTENNGRADSTARYTEPTGGTRAGWVSVATARTHPQATAQRTAAACC